MKLCEQVKLEPESLEEIKEEMEIEKSTTEKKTSLNDTKNIPKNFGKAVIAFINKHPKLVTKCLERHGIELSKFLVELKSRKKNLHSIKELRSLWLEE